MTEDRDIDRLAIWGNDKKETDRHPDFKGNGAVKCCKCGNVQEVWVSAWKRGPDENPKSPALRLTVQPKEQQHQRGMAQAQAAASAPPAAGGFVDEDVPF